MPKSVTFTLLPGLTALLVLAALFGVGLLCPAHGSGAFRLTGRGLPGRILARRLTGSGTGHTFGGGAGLVCSSCRGSTAHATEHGGVVNGGVVEIKEHTGVLAEFLQIIQQCRCGVIPAGGFLGHGLHNDLLQTAGDVGIQHRGHLCAAVDVLDGHPTGDSPS